ncbi:MAG TPA: sugar phosphate isomerase/epimerase family protein [Acidimicrobiales bacterium]|nr:sugar phosphate isomerase/epimerase family protein [Acidimicrobiales bacterium]
MKFAFSAPTPSISEQEVLFSQYRSNGYEGLQLKAAQYLPYLDEPESAVRIARADPGRFSGLIFGGSLDEGGQNALRRTIDFAAQVGSERVIFWHGLPRAQASPDDVARFASVLSRLGSVAKTKGVRLSLHHHYNHPVMFPPDIELFFEHVEPGTVGLTIDTAHMWMAGQDDVGATIKQFCEVLDNVHLKDCHDNAPHERLSSGARRETSFRSLGQGEVDFDPIFAALGSVGYSGWLCVDEESGGDVAASLKSSHDFIVRRISVPLLAQGEE